MTGTATILAISSNDLLLGLAAAVLVVFALVVSLVLPRRRPNFPGRHMGAFFAVTVLLVVGMLAAVEAFGEAHEFHTDAPDAPGTAPTTPADTQEGDTGETGETGGETGETDETGETGGEAEGDPAAGQEVFASAGCGSCHALAEAGTSGAIGPDLDEALPGQSPDEILTQIVDPNSEIADGFQAGVMPENYDEQLTEEQLADLVAFLAGATSG